MIRTTARIGAIAALAALLAACHAQGGHGGKSAAAAPAAPQNACMQVTAPTGKPQTLRAVAYDTPNLETCAMYIEGLRLEQRHDTLGLWNGVYVYADAQGVDSAAAPGAARYALYSADQRQQIDQSLQAQIAEARSSKPAAPQP
jgi:ABC-type Fe3+-hydroxamate transport system substrate-binding protein